jgi:large subunit ribosomal protein L30
MEGTIKIKLVRSPICTPEKHKRIVKGLGLRKLNQVVERPDSPVFRGMVEKVPHLLKIIAEPAEIGAREGSLVPSVGQEASALSSRDREGAVEAVEQESEQR